jgi:hypothetical protein
LARTLDTPVRAANDVATAAVDWYLRVVVFVSGGSASASSWRRHGSWRRFRHLTLYLGEPDRPDPHYLSIGYAVGGRIADRWPHISHLYGITAVAAFVTGLIPVLAQPILAKEPHGVRGSLARRVLQFAGGDAYPLCRPVTLLGCVSPFAIRLALASVSGPAIPPARSTPSAPLVVSLARLCPPSSSSAYRHVPNLLPVCHCAPRGITDRSLPCAAH